MRPLRVLHLEWLTLVVAEQVSINIWEAPILIEFRNLFVCMMYVVFNVYMNPQILHFSPG